MFVNGTHPLLPWLAFFCAGIVLGRLLDTTWWRTAAIGGGFTLFTIANLVSASASGRRALDAHQHRSRSIVGSST